MRNRFLKKDIGIKEEENLFIFGAGNYAGKLCEFYGEEEIKKNVECFVVSKKQGNPDVFYEVPVKEIAELDREMPGIIIIALAKDVRAQIEKDIRKMFHNVIELESFMDMAVFLQQDNTDRNYEIDQYYKYFMKEKPLFRYIEIETINRCNGSCNFCPVNRFQPQRPFAKMHEKLFYKIVNELSSIEYDGRAALFSNNEPFLDNRIIEFAKYARSQLPKAYIYLDSNGLLLTLEKFVNIIDYLDIINLDIYVESLKEDIPAHIQEIVEYASVHNLMKKINISKIDVHAIRSSRGGESPNSKVDFTIKDRCPLLLLQMVVRPDGNVSLCCNDALGKVTLGNITEESLLDVWNSRQYNRLRELIMAGRENLSLCKWCDYVDMRELYS